MRGWLCVLVAASSIAGCDSYKNVPCSAGCAKYHAVCNPLTNTCEVGLVLDMAMRIEEDMTPARRDLSTQDGPPAPECTVATAATDCAAATPICDNGQCRACAAGDDSACSMRSSSTPRCATAGAKAGQCVACTPVTQGSDCSGTTPVCASDNTCRGCAANGECPTLGKWSDNTTIAGYCVQDGAQAGACINSTQVAFVDNRSQSITACGGAAGQMHDGTTPAKAFCDVQDAITATTPMSFVVVAGRGVTFSYGTSSDGGHDLDVTRSVTVIGPGATPTSTNNALLSATGNTGVSSPCVTVENNATLILFGFEVGATMKNAGIVVNSGGTLIARHNWVHGAQLGGVSCSMGTITLDANWVEFSPNAGVTLTSCKYDLVNNIVDNNSGGGVLITSPQAGSTFAFNTVASNNAGGSVAGGISCIPSASIQSSIVFMNSTSGVGGSTTQFAGTCNLMNVVTGSDTANPGMTAAPVFLGGNDYHLNLNGGNEATNKACCIDKAPTPTVANFHDVDLQIRPQGAGYDIGADEAE
jgi:hypothetical protein